MDENKVRIADVAEELGLSTATVSNVLHGKTHKMSEATIKRVEQKLEETGYIPNMAGILLARNGTALRSCGASALFLRNMHFRRS